MNWLVDVFRPLERFEALLAELYGAFSERFAADPPAAQLFAGLSRASKARKSQVEFLHRLAKSIEKQLPEPNLDAARIAREVEAIERIRGMLEYVTVEAAVGQAIQFECGMAKWVSNNAIGPAHPDLAQMIRGFGARRDGPNAGLLLAFAEERKVPLPPQLVAAARNTIAANAASMEESAAAAAAARASSEAAAAKRAAEEAELEAAVKAGMTPIEYRLKKKK